MKAPKMLRDVGREVRAVVNAIRRLKERVLGGRLWDELHRSESRISRAADGRKSTFATKKKDKGAAKSLTAADVKRMIAAQMKDRKGV